MYIFLMTTTQSTGIQILKVQGVRLVEVFENPVVAFVDVLVTGIGKVYMIGFYQPAR